MTVRSLGYGLLAEPPMPLPGPKGDKGDPGPKGDKGDPGPAGPAPIVFAKRLMTDANGDVTVSFPAGLFAAGTVPVVHVAAEAPANSTALFTAEVQGQPSHALAKIKAFRQNLTTTVTGTVGVLLLPPGAIPVHVIAALPT